jgi:hypothetical protein
MLTADCQNSGGEGKTLGLHSTAFQTAAMEALDLITKRIAKKPKNVRNWSSRVNVSAEIPPCRSTPDAYGSS